LNKKAFSVWIFVIACLLAGTPPTVEVRAADGASVSGTLVELDAHRLVVQGPAGPSTWEIGKLTAVAVKEPKSGPAGSAPVLVELVDGSTLAAISFSVDKAQARVGLPDGQAAELPGRDVKSVRFIEPTEATSGPWARMVKEATGSDILVVKKGESIDYHKGVLGSVTKDTVEFQLDGERLPVKRDKVFGIVYRRPSGREVPEPMGFVVDANGSTWAIQSIALAGDQFQWTTPLGVKISRPATSVTLLDFSRGKLVYLSDLKPESVEWVPYFSTGKEPPTQIALFAPRTDRSLESGPLQLNRQRYAKGLAIHSRTTMVYRLPERYRRLSAVIGIDDAVRPQGNVRLVIRGDDRVLWDMAVAGTDSPRTVDLDITGVRRLAILVDFGDDFDVGDHLDLCEARLVK
jgi:hypothetical protein